MSEQAPQRKYDLRAMFNALRWMARAGAPWHLIPNHFPPWEAIYQQTQRWLRPAVSRSWSTTCVSILRIAQGKQGQPSAVIFDGRTVQSTCQSGPRADYDGYKRKKGSKVRTAVDTLGYRPGQSFSTLARYYERLPETLAGLHFVVFATLMLINAATILQSS